MKKSLPVICLVSLLAVFSLVLAACGSKSTTTPTTTPATTPTTGASTKTTPTGAMKGGGSTLQLAADPSALKFDTTSLSAKAGKVTIEFTNPAATGHDVKIEASNNKQIAITPIISQSKATLTANLKAGTYSFYCTVPGHEAAGMKGTLTVN